MEWKENVKEDAFVKSFDTIKMKRFNKIVFLKNDKMINDVSMKSKFKTIEFYLISITIAGAFINFVVSKFHRRF